MKSCDLVSGLTKLQRCTSRLHQVWSTTSEHWDDKNKQEFAEAHVAPLAPLVQMTTSAVQKLAETLREAERDCADEGSNDFF